MFPISSIASSIFASVWALVLLGAIRTRQSIEFPFDPIWLEHARRHLRSIHAFRDVLAQKAQFTPEIAEMLLDDLKMRRTRHMIVDLQDVDLRILLSLGDMKRARPTSDAERRELVETAIRAQFVVLIENLLFVQYSAMLASLPFDTTAVEDLLWLAHELTGEESPLGARDSRALLRIVADEWAQTRTAPLRDVSPDVHAWVREQIEGFRAA